jgi:hypothetical protein
LRPHVGERHRRAAVAIIWHPWQLQTLRGAQERQSSFCSAVSCPE